MLSASWVKGSQTSVWVGKDIANGCRKMPTEGESRTNAPEVQLEGKCTRNEGGLVMGERGEWGGNMENKVNPWLKPVLDQVKNDPCPRGVAGKEKAEKQRKTNGLQAETICERKQWRTNTRKRNTFLQGGLSSTFITCVNRGVVGTDE